MCMTDKFWQVLCDAIDRHDLAAHPDYATAVARRANRAALTVVLDAVLGAASTAEWLARLADHGAEVIKVEPPGEGDPGRHIGLAQGGHATFFRNANRGKQSLCLNLKVPAARAALLQLAETADVFIEAFRPGVVDRLGVGYRDVAARNPRIVYVSISAFGQSAPAHTRPPWYRY